MYRREFECHTHLLTVGLIERLPVRSVEHFVVPTVGGRKREGWDSGGMEEKTGKVRIRGRRQGSAALAVSLDDT